MKATCRRVPTNISPREQTTLVLDGDERHQVIKSLTVAVRVMSECHLSNDASVDTLVQMIGALSLMGLPSSSRPCEYFPPQPMAAIDARLQSLKDSTTESAEAARIIKTLLDK